MVEYLKQKSEAFDSQNNKFLEKSQNDSFNDSILNCYWFNDDIFFYSLNCFYSFNEYIIWSNMRKYKEHLIFHEF